MAWSKKTIVIGGIEIVCDPRDAVIDGSKLSTEMDKVPAQMAFWGSALSTAVREKVLADAEYRAWRARAYKAIMEADPKLAEYKVKVNCEAHPSFMEHKRKIATADENVVVCEKFFEAFSKKANQLQSRGATKREELKKGTIRTMDSDSEDDAGDAEDDDDDESPSPFDDSAAPKTSPGKSKKSDDDDGGEPKARPKPTVELLSTRHKNKKHKK